MKPRGNLRTEIHVRDWTGRGRDNWIARNLQLLKDTRQKGNRRGDGVSYVEMAVLAIHSSRFERSQLE
jgi:hypothetical protein